MKKFEVTMTCIYNGLAIVEAENEEDALAKVEEALNYETLEKFPNEVTVPFGSFTFGEATADYADEVVK